MRGCGQETIRTCCRSFRKLTAAVEIVTINISFVGETLIFRIHAYTMSFVSPKLFSCGIRRVSHTYKTKLGRNGNWVLDASR